MSEHAKAVPADAPDTVPLCVDLDGTLVHGDLLHEAAIAALKTSPAKLIGMMAALRGGRAALKAYLVEHAAFDPALLPYRADLIDYIREQRATGRPVHLVTASPRAWAEAVADHLGLFDAVQASETTNLKGPAKADMLRTMHAGGYDYVGDSRADMPVWRGARSVLRAGRGTRLTLEAPLVSSRDFPEPTRPLAAIIRAMRPHQWLKNMLVFVPLVTSHEWMNPALLITAIVAMLSFSFAASATYLLNDMLDIPADRAHKRKRKRPFASGATSIPTGLAVMGLLLLLAVGMAAALGVGFLIVLVGYMVVTTAYSIRLKRAMLVDVFTLAGLYSVRVVGGGVATHVPLSLWLLAFSMFLFLALAIVKRCAELVDRPDTGTARVAGRGYYGDDLSVLQSLGSASSFSAVMVFSLYVTQPEVTKLYVNPALLWLIAPLLLYWLSRMMLLAQRGKMHDDPLVFAVKDRKSLWIIALCGVIMVAAVKLQTSIGIVVPIR